MHPSSKLFAALSLIVAAACDAPKDTSPEGIADRPNAASSSAGPSMPSAKASIIACSDAIDGICAKTGAFTTTTPRIFLSASASKLPRNGARVVFLCAADAVESVAANTKVAQTEFTVDDSSFTRAAANGFTYKASVTKPTKGWPAGRYRATFTEDGMTVATTTFVVTK